ncbi:MAG: zf-HC2 domain-containing protein [Blastocatellia bacterium]
MNSLSDYMDGKGLWLADNELRSIEDHLAMCPHCRSLKQELGQIQTAARELPLHTPPRALWARISTAVEAELSIHDRPTRRDQPEMSWWERLKSARFTFNLPQLAGAGALAVAMMITGSYFIRSTSATLNLPGMQSALLAEEPEMKAEINRRMTAMEPRKAKWDPQMRAEFDQHMAKINESLRLCRENLLANPGEVVNYQRTIRALYAEQRQLLDDVERLKW